MHFGERFVVRGAPSSKMRRYFGSVLARCTYRVVLLSYSYMPIKYAVAVSIRT